MKCYLFLSLLFNRQEYNVREERTRELEFLEKVWELCNFILLVATGVSFGG